MSGPVYPQQNITPSWVLPHSHQMFICRRDIINTLRDSSLPLVFFRSFFRNPERHNHEAWILWSIVSHKALDRKCFAGNWDRIWNKNHLLQHEHFPFFVVFWEKKRDTDENGGYWGEEFDLVFGACPLEYNIHIQLPCRNKERTIPSEYYIPKMTTTLDSTVVNAFMIGWLHVHTKHTLHRDPLDFCFWCHWFHGTKG